MKRSNEEKRVLKNTLLSPVRGRGENRKDYRHSLGRRLFRFGFAVLRDEVSDLEEIVPLRFPQLFEHGFLDDLVSRHKPQKTLREMPRPVPVRDRNALGLRGRGECHDRLRQYIVAERERADTMRLRMRDQSSEDDELRTQGSGHVTTSLVGTVLLRRAAAFAARARLLQEHISRHRR